MGGVFGRVAAFTCSVVLLCVGGCGGAACTGAASDETEDESFVLAEKFIAEERYDDAIKCLHIVQKSREAAPESSFLLGSLYLEKKNDSIGAMYFLRQCIAELGGRDPARAKFIEQLIDTAKKKFLKSFPAYNGVSQTESELIEIARALQVQNTALRSQISTYRQKLSEYEGKVDVLSNCSQNGRFRQKVGANKTMHTVKEGETLSSISTKYYGNPNLWQKILEANDQILKDPADLRPGQNLMVP
ncbi:MAG: LysM peptidoglycan-binding domain-containing protein [Puniceicoccales bacterium]|jgi:LysM repeat protein|nr:LysM peptidoglycan-binding domain-containing protein [Puniceicoccales bacterium]